MGGMRSTPSQPGLFVAPEPTVTPGPAFEHKPTDEQQAIIETYLDGQPLVVEALAGTGKTTTLRMLAATTPARKGVYVAYNKSIVEEARGRFPEPVQIATAHSLAYQAVGHRYAHRLPGRGSTGSRRMRAQEIAELLDIRSAAIGERRLTPAQVTRLAEATVTRFCQSADHEISPQHLPARAEHLGDRQELAAAIVPAARKIWRDLANPNGRLYFTHDHYLKIWQLGNPRIEADYILFDEAQDANPAIAAVIRQQTHAQLVYVGDRNQQLYSWRGAIDAMDDIDGKRLALTRSFRFGPAVAELANRWLDLLGAPHRVVGYGAIDSKVGPLTDKPDAILCRTNGTALGHILAYQAQGVRVALAPGDPKAGMDIKLFAWAARDLMNGRGTNHPELVSFTSWSDLLQYVDEEESGQDLKRLVNIVHRIGPQAVINAVDKLTTRDRAEVTVSTGHKAKGLEWARVRIADDFGLDIDEKPERADLMLAYVAVTRGRRELDPGPLDPGLWETAMESDPRRLLP